MEAVACWHHSDLDRLCYHLAHNRIDLYGPEERTPKRQDYRLQMWWKKMRLKNGDKIRVVVKGKIVATATVKSEPRTLPPDECKPPWGSAVDLDSIVYYNPPEPVHCSGNGFGSHRLDGHRPHS